MVAKRKNDFDDLPSRLIEPRRPAQKQSSSSVSKNDDADFDNPDTPETIMINELSNWLSRIQADNLSATYENICQFESNLLRQWSLLLTKNKTDRVLGFNVNEFFCRFILIVNRLGLYHEALLEHGIELPSDNDLDDLF